jgi:hypothetical protein
MSELIHHMKGFAEECLRRIEATPSVDGNELHTKQTYTDILKLCESRERLRSQVYAEAIEDACHKIIAWFQRHEGQGNLLDAVRALTTPAIPQERERELDILIETAITMGAKWAVDEATEDIPREVTRPTAATVYRRAAELGADVPRNASGLGAMQHWTG